jgi:L-rhamnose isomerase
MNEEDWSDIVPCDSYECFKVMNDLHLKVSNHYSHHKGHTLFKMASEIDFAHNVTNNFCSIISAACPVCKDNIRGKKKKKNR